jgi:hypothetical protein
MVQRFSNKKNKNKSSEKADGRLFNSDDLNKNPVSTDAYKSLIIINLLEQNEKE